MTLDTIPIDVVELICSHIVDLAFAEFELADFILREDDSLEPYRRFKSWSLKSLPLIHPLWRLPGTTALYRHVFLTSADQYKAFHQSLESSTTKRPFVRSITIRWGPHDFGGPEGYAYKVLGWWYQMEIEHLIRLCPRLESFDPGSRSIVITEEGIAALGDLTELRAIVLRPVDIEKIQDLQLLNSKKLDTLRLVTTWESYPQTIFQTLHQVRKLGMPHDFSTLVSRSGALFNLRELEVDYPPGIVDYCPPLPNLICLTIRKQYVHALIINHYLKTFLRLQVLSVKFADPMYCLLQSDSLVTMKFYVVPFGPVGIRNQDEHEFIEKHVRRKNLPSLKELIQIQWEDVEDNFNGPLRCRNILPKSWDVEEKDRSILHIGDMIKFQLL
jgi:hypothetical protein